jgi:hypothetical protein
MATLILGEKLRLKLSFQFAKYSRYQVFRGYFSESMAYVYRLKVCNLSRKVAQCRRVDRFIAGFGGSITP